MKNIIQRNYKDVIALVIILISIVSLIFMDNRISDSLRQFLYSLIGICTGYIFRGDVLEKTYKSK